MGSVLANSNYAIVRVRSNFKKDYRVVQRHKDWDGLGRYRQTEDVISDYDSGSAGKALVKLIPEQPLTHWRLRAHGSPLRPAKVNLSVWDFRIDPQGPDNKNALMPLQRSSDNDR